MPTQPAGTLQPCTAYRKVRMCPSLALSHCFPLQEDHPCALHHFDQIAARAAGKLVAVFLDYDGAQLAKRLLYTLLLTTCLVNFLLIAQHSTT